MNQGLQVVSETDARKVAEVLHLSHVSGDVPTVDEMRRALTLMQDMGLTLSQTSFFTFKNNQTQKVEVTVAAKAQAVMGMAMKVLRPTGVIEIAGGLVVREGAETIDIDDEMPGSGQ